MVERHLEQLCTRLPQLQEIRADFVAAFRMCVSSFQGGGTLFLAGNGGSRADAEHIAGELMKGFMLPRRVPPSQKAALTRRFGEEGEYLARGLQRGLPAVVLGSSPALASAVANDTAADLVYAQHLYAMARPGDVLLGISTSGNARNVVLACELARTLQMRVLGLSGTDGGRLRELSDVCLCMPVERTFEIQELHLPVYHCLCQALEEAFFGE